MSNHKMYLGFLTLLILFATLSTATASPLSDELQSLASYIACIGQYSMAETGDYKLGDPVDHYQPRHIAEYLAKRSGNRTKTDTFYGICFDYAHAAYNEISQNASHYESLGMASGGYYIAGAFENNREIILLDPVHQGQHTMLLNGVYVKEHSRQNVLTHGEGSAKMHGWLWVIGNDGTIYWIDPTWTDNNGYIWWGIVQDGKEVQGAPLKSLCMVEVNPDSPSFARFSRGDASRNSGNYSQATTEYNEALRLDPNNALAYLNRGSSFLQTYDFDSAMKDFNQAVRLSPNLAMAYVGRGVVYLNKNETDKAIVELNKAISLDANFAVAFSCRASAYALKQNLDQALADVNIALRLDPNLAQAYSLRGYIYLRKENNNQALNDYNQALKIDPNDPQIYAGRALVYMAMDNNSRALADTNQALNLNPNCVDALYYRGLIYYLTDDYDRAIADFEAVLRLYPGHPAIEELEEIRQLKRQAQQPTVYICPNCNGNGGTVCPYCSGAGTIWTATGLVQCAGYYTAQGYGTTYCNRGWIACPVCQGSGKVISN